jgi:hypothetical protein
MYFLRCLLLAKAATSIEGGLVWRPKITCHHLRFSIGGGIKEENDMVVGYVASNYDCTRGPSWKGVVVVVPLSKTVLKTISPDVGRVRIFWLGYFCLDKFGPVLAS